VAILIEAESCEWQSICACVLAAAKLCEKEGHYIWYRGASEPEWDREVETLIRHLGLEDQFSHTRDYAPSEQAVVMRASEF